MLQTHMDAQMRKSLWHQFPSKIASFLTIFALDGFSWQTGLHSSIARYTVESILLPLTPGIQKREIRVTGERTTWQKFIDDLGEVQGAKYKCTYLDPAEAAAKQDEARKSGDEVAELIWSVKPLAASGNGIVPGQLDNDKFSFRPESVKETFKRVYG